MIVNYTLDSKVINKKTKEAELITITKVNSTPQESIYRIMDSNDKVIGEAEVELNTLGYPNEFYIMRMKNLAPNQYQGLGKALHELVFRESVLGGKNGHVSLGAGYGSSLFHMNCGFKSLNNKPFYNIDKECTLLLDEVYPDKINGQVYLNWYKKTNKQADKEDELFTLLSKNHIKINTHGYLVINASKENYTWITECFEDIPMLEKQIHQLYSIGNVLDFYQSLYKQSNNLDFKNRLLNKIAKLGDLKFHLPDEIIAQKRKEFSNLEDISPALNEKKSIKSDGNFQKAQETIIITKSNPIYENNYVAKTENEVNNVTSSKTIFFNSNGDKSLNSINEIEADKKELDQKSDEFLLEHSDTKVPKT